MDKMALFVDVLSMEKYVCDRSLYPSPVHYLSSMIDETVGVIIDIHAHPHRHGYLESDRTRANYINLHAMRDLYDLMCHILASKETNKS